MKNSLFIQQAEHLSANLNKYMIQAEQINKTIVKERAFADLQKHATKYPEIFNPNTNIQP